MGRLANSWEATKQSWGVLRKDKELLLFPVLSAAASLLVIASFLFPTWYFGYVDRAVDQDDPNAKNLLMAVYFVMYLVLAFVTIYFQSALMHAANERLSGGDPNILTGLRGANARLGRIFAWSLFAGTVSLLIHLLESAMRQRNNIVGRIVAQVVGTAWALATYFAIPIVLFEEQGVFGSLRRSGQLFRQRWGESLVGQYGIGFVFGLLATFVLFATVGLFMAVGGLGAAGLVLALGILAAGLVALALVVVVGHALGAVYKVALYRFASQGQVAPGYDSALIQNAYRAT